MLTLPFSSALFIGSPIETDFQSATTMSLSRIETRISEIATSVQRHFAARVESKPITTSFRASDPRHLPIRDQFLASRFERQAGYYLTNIVHQGNPVVCQLQEFKLRGPETVLTSSEDVAIGVSSRLRYTFSANSHRTSPDGIRWGDWITGLPPVLSTIELANQEGNWTIDASPGLLPLHSHPPLR